MQWPHIYRCTACSCSNSLLLFQCCASVLPFQSSNSKASYCVTNIPTPYSTSNVHRTSNASLAWFSIFPQLFSYKCTCGINYRYIMNRLTDFVMFWTFVAGTFDIQHNVKDRFQWTCLLVCNTELIRCSKLGQLYTLNHLK